MRTLLELMDFFNAMDISTTGIIAQRYRMNVVAENLANMESTRTENGGPYRRKQVVMSAVDGNNSFLDILMGAQSPTPKLSGARITEVVDDPTPFKNVHRPGHPDADANGYVKMPNVNAIIEMGDILMATRAYEANITAFSTAKSMIAKVMELGKS